MSATVDIDSLPVFHCFYQGSHNHHFDYFAPIMHYLSVSMPPAVTSSYQKMQMEF